MATDVESPDESESLLELNFEQVVKEEHKHISTKRERRPREDCPRPRFALAFSGGGVRAAAFQAGALWRLAQEGRLKDVDYFAAVSGGAYVAAAFASHVCASTPPQQGESVDAWYLSVVAKTISRMQENAGDFVRDANKVLKHSTGDTGLLPRVCDIPMLMLTFLFTIVIVPLELLIVYVVPITEGIYLFFGAALRITVCASDTPAHWKVLKEWSPFGHLLVLFEVCLIASFVLWLLSNLPPFELGEKGKDGKYRCQGYLWIHSSLAFLTRFVVTMLVLLGFLLLVPQMQLFSYNEAMRTMANYTQGGFCMQYMSMGGVGIMRHGAEVGCANLYNGRTWYRDTGRLRETPGGRSVLLATDGGLHGAESQLTGRELLVPASAVRANEVRDGKIIPDNSLDLAASVLRKSKSISSAVFSVLFITLVVAMFLVPYFPGLLLAVLWVTGPILVFLLVAILLQYRIFGPLTGQPLMFSWFPFHERNWDHFVGFCLLATLVVVPFYNDLRRLWHWFYVRSLRMSFFAEGADLPFNKLGENPYCPMMIFTGTVSDFKRPGAEVSINEISFSPLHTGSEATGYLRTPEWRTLAKCTALTGAGCLDALTLSIHNHLRFRFYLEMLNLSWGDFILFVRKEHQVAQRIASMFGTEYERSMLTILHRLPVLSVWLVIFGLVWGGWMLSSGTTEQRCSYSRGLMGSAAILVIAIFGVSFFGFNDYCSWVLFSPVIRQMHQATQFFFQGHKPPPLLYVTDGGVQDCTAIVQLIRRKCERILLVLAASDPHDELGVLLAAMEVVKSEKLGCFFDPSDARRDVQILLEEFKTDLEQRSFVLGLRYGWKGDVDEAALGTLVVVKNRLPTSMSSMPVRPLLTQEELMRDSSSQEHEPVDDVEKEWRDLRVSDLGGLGCCDCCHRHNCNCGTKFPHLTGANYLWLTPRLYSSLCRLGHQLSEEALKHLPQ